MTTHFPPHNVSCPKCGAQVGEPCSADGGVTHVERANLIGPDLKPIERRVTAGSSMTTRHGFGPELGRKPTTYTCRCGFRSTDYAEVGRHITEEHERAHTPRRLTTIPAANVSPPAGIEIASTPHGDEHDAVEIRAVIRERDGVYHHHMVLIRRHSIPFLIEALEAHRLEEAADPCAACAAQTFAARLTDDTAKIEHTCPDPKAGAS